VSGTLFMAAGLLAAISDAATRAHPDECCGLIEGARIEGAWRATAVHETRNLADNPARSFLIDPEAQFRLLRALRGTDRAIIGCFHSHPNGPAEPSARDLAEAVEDGFVWLIAGEDGRFGAYVYRAAAHAFEPLAVNRSG
jgi:proteasome lid subunit RPN8/RPN11